ncbi:hypothetical protein [Amycolatopsis sp. lyj-112]|uniref:hypothetical protein n=1 Tax=Amycolatopsis sp. lyj-112 TaxID=2789288 RepID=UPI00397B2800
MGVVLGDAVVGRGGCGTPADPLGCGGSAGSFDEVGVTSSDFDVGAAELDVRRLDVVLVGFDELSPPVPPPVPT